MLNMLPKFELVPISRYFITLPDARRPSRMPRCSTRRPVWPRMMSAASRATSAAVSPRCRRRRYAATARR